MKFIRGRKLVRSKNKNLTVFDRIKKKKQTQGAVDGYLFSLGQYVPLPNSF